MTAPVNTETKEIRVCPATPSPLTASSGPSTSTRRTSRTTDSKKPRPAVQRHVGGAVWNRPIRLTGREVPMAVTIQADGRIRPHLTVAGDTTPPTLEVIPVRAEALATCLNTLLTGELAPVDEVTTFELLLAAAYNKGVQHQRELAGVS